jgi:hypothetical protein
MYYQRLYEQWAPPGAPWSAWAKPVLFAQLDAQPRTHQPVGDWRHLRTDWAPPPGGVVIVIDLPGLEAVLMGLALAERGYRPVPLYNCCLGPAPVLDVSQITDGLDAGGPILESLGLPYMAAPAFLLDSRRQQPGQSPSPGRFDNRWVTLPQDFPSANLLISRGYRQAVLVQNDRLQPQGDLAHVLCRWQEQGMAVLAVQPQRDDKPRPLRVSRPSHFRWMWYAFLATLGLRRNSTGGFGAVIPEPSSSSSGGSFG